MEYNTNIEGFRLVDAEESDSLHILDLIKGIAKYEKMEDDVLATEESIRNSIFKRNRAKVILAKENETIIGYMLYFYNFSTFIGSENIYLEDLFLYEEYRHKGYGKIMFKCLANIALKENIKRIDWVCLDWNKVGLNFYKSINAKKLDFWLLHRLEGEDIKQLALE